MGTIELLKNMQEKCLNGGKYDDPLRMEKYQALEKAIKAIENQPKYEKTIADMGLSGSKAQRKSENIAMDANILTMKMNHVVAEGRRR